MTAALDIAGLTKTFDENVAVDHVDLTRPPGLVLRAGRPERGR